MKWIFVRRIAQFGLIGAFLCFFCTTQTRAQTTSDVTEAAPAGPFVSPSEAVDLLEAEMRSLEVDMSNHPHASQDYKIAQWRYVYYEYIVKLINLSEAQTSSDIGLIIIRGLRIYNSDMYGDIPKETMESNKSAAITLLKT